MHELWHSIARYFGQGHDNSSFWEYGEHNPDETWSLMDGSGPSVGDYLTQADFYATAMYAPRMVQYRDGSLSATIHYPSLSLNNSPKGIEIGGGVCNEYMVDSADEKCMLMEELDCDESGDICPHNETHE